MYIMLNNANIVIGESVFGAVTILYIIIVLLQRRLFGIQIRECVLLDRTVGCCRYAHILHVVSVLAVE